MERCTHLEFDKILRFGERTGHLPEDAAGLLPASLRWRVERVCLQVGAAVRQHDDSI